MSESQKDTLSRWLPTMVAIAAIIGNILYLGARAGALEQRINYTENALQHAVTRAEYQADKNASANQLADLKTTLREINAKLDRIVEQQRNRSN